MVRTKFRVVSITQHIGDPIARTIKLGPYFDHSIPEDQRFAQATPSGEISIYVNNLPAIAELQLGKYFYVDFTPADDL